MTVKAGMPSLAVPLVDLLGVLLNWRDRTHHGWRSSAMAKAAYSVRSQPTRRSCTPQSHAVLSPDETLLHFLPKPYVALVWRWVCRLLATNPYVAVLPESKSTRARFRLMRENSGKLSDFFCGVFS